VGEHRAQIRAAGERARALVQRLLVFARRQPVRPVAQPLQRPVDEALAMLRGMLPVSAQLDARLADEPLVVRADATQVQQLLLNLVTNAWHALRDGRGRIEVALDAVELGVDAAAAHGLPAGRYARLAVADDGSGIDEATRARIFEPFFTTKPAGQGTGLGLATVYGIVESHGGAVAVDSHVGQGTTFTVLLPRVDAADAVAAGEAAAGAADAAAQGSAMREGAPPAAVGAAAPRRVIYVDDDETLVLLADRLLRRAGFEVSGFADAALALAAVRAAPEAFDAVVTDQQMPRLSGIDVARAVAGAAPALPVIVASGYVDDELERAAAAAGVRALLHKERLAEDLLPALRRVLAGAAR
jgi:CheY-like chemotaxis protein